jgi:hypothetical protein
MRLCLKTARVLILLVVAPTAALAQDDAVLAERNAARRALEMAKIELRLYLQVEHPREVRRLDAQIKLTEAEIEAYEERLREYRSVDKFSTGRPLLVTLQDVRLCLLELQLRLRDLRAERQAMIRFHSDQWRLMELQVHEARMRVVDLERGDELPVPQLPAPQRTARAGG